MEQEGLFIMFNVDEEDIDITFAYILLRANEYNYFNPKLSTGEIYELYESIMNEYSNIFNYNFEIKETAVNMEVFFTATDYLDDEAMYFIDSVFGVHIGSSMFLQTYNKSATVLLDVHEPGSIILNIAEIHEHFDFTDQNRPF